MLISLLNSQAAQIFFSCFMLIERSSPTAGTQRLPRLVGKFGLVDAIVSADKLVSTACSCALFLSSDLGESRSQAGRHWRAAMFRWRAERWAAIGLA